MTCNTGDFKLTPATQKKLLSRGYSLVCHKCETMIELGQRVISKRADRNGGCSRNHYHKVCWEKMHV